MGKKALLGSLFTKLPSSCRREQRAATPATDVNNEDGAAAAFAVFRQLYWIKRGKHVSENL
jgi:hypothetical protein